MSTLCPSLPVFPNFMMGKICNWPLSFPTISPNTCTNERVESRGQKVSVCTASRTESEAGMRSCVLFFFFFGSDDRKVNNINNNKKGIKKKQKQQQDQEQSVFSSVRNRPLHWPKPWTCRRLRLRWRRRVTRNASLFSLPKRLLVFRLLLLTMASDRSVTSEWSHRHDVTPWVTWTDASENHNRRSLKITV